MEEQEEKAKSKEDEVLATVFLEQKNTAQIEPACKKAYKWVPSLYFVEGLPNVIVTVLAVAFYNKMGFSNTEVAFFTSWLYLPWVIKPFWSPIVDSFKTKRWWVLGMQFIRLRNLLRMILL